MIDDIRQEVFDKTLAKLVKQTFLVGFIVGVFITIIVFILTQ